MTKMASTCGHVSTFFTSVQSVNEIYIIIKRLCFIVQKVKKINKLKQRMERRAPNELTDGKPVREDCNLVIQNMTQKTKHKKC